MGNTKLPTWHHRYDSQAQTVVAQQFGLDEKALESALAAKRAAASKERDDLGLSPQAFARYIVAEAIRAYLTASDAEREPVAWQKRCLFPDRHTGEKAQWQDCPAMEVKSWPQHDYEYRPLYAAPLPLTDLEAENARLRERLDEALKALEPFAKVAPVFDHQRIPAPCEDHHTVYKWETKGTGEVELVVADFRAARRVREGGE